MEVSVNVVSNLHLRSQLHPTIESVREGKALADTLEQTGAAPEILVDMVEVGEATGSLDSMLSDVSDFLDEEVDTRLQRVLSLLEPVMLVLMGIIIAATVVAGGGEAILPSIIKGGNPWLALLVFALLGWILIRIPAKSASE